jgi:hypothetical protein
MKSKILNVLLMFFLLILCVFFKTFFFADEETKKIQINVNKWREDLKQSYFSGIVKKIEKSENGFRFYGSIFIKVTDSGGIKIPDSCAFLKSKNNLLILDALHMNISIGQQHEIIVSDIIKKIKGSDSICIYSKEGSYKYYFEIFDGFDGPLKMNLLASVGARGNNK